MATKKQDDAVRAIDNLLHNLNRPKFIPREDIVYFYNEIETNYNSNIDSIETILFEEIKDEEKFDKLKKISNLLEINIF